MPERWLGSSNAMAPEALSGGVGGGGAVVPPEREREKLFGKSREVLDDTRSNLELRGPKNGLKNGP
eukprot:13686877-Alexandrium_andersonii.AAC.1